MVDRDTLPSIHLSLLIVWKPLKGGFTNLTFWPPKENGGTVCWKILVTNIVQPINVSEAPWQGLFRELLLHCPLDCLWFKAEILCHTGHQSCLCLRHILVGNRMYNSQIPVFTLLAKWYWAQHTVSGPQIHSLKCIMKTKYLLCLLPTLPALKPSF